MMLSLVEEGIMTNFHQRHTEISMTPPMNVHHVQLVGNENPEQAYLRLSGALRYREASVTLHSSAVSQEERPKTILRCEAHLGDSSEK